MKLILGSSSKYRKAVLEQAGMEFEAVSPDIDEKAVRSENLYELPLLIGREKMAALKTKISEPAVIVAADQIVICEGKLREKPVSPEEATQFLSEYRAGYPAETVSALVVYNSETGRTAEGIDVAKTFFNPIPEEVMAAYIESGEAYYNAGAFAYEHPLLAPYVKKMEGKPDSVSGMPLDLLHRLITAVS
jgi:septum formation protein